MGVGGDCGQLCVGNSWWTGLSDDCGCAVAVVFGQTAFDEGVEMDSFVLLVFDGQLLVILSLSDSD